MFCADVGECGGWVHVHNDDTRDYDGKCKQIDC